MSWIHKIGEMENYVIRYSYLGEERLAFAEARDIGMAEDLFKKNYSELCKIKEIQTEKEHSKEFVRNTANSLLDIVKEAFD